MLQDDAIAAEGRAMQLQAELDALKVTSLQEQHKRVLAVEEQASLVHLCLQLPTTEFAQHILSVC